MRLFEISDQIEQILADQVDHDTGEITAEAIELLEALELERDAKALAVAAYLVGERAEADAIARQAKVLLERADRHHKRADRLQDYLVQHIDAGRKLSDTRVSISWRKSTRVEIAEGAEEKLEERFVRVTVAPDKIALKEALAKGEKVDGARLVERVGIVVR